MKTIQSIVLTAIVLATTAYAGDAVKQQSTAALSEVEPISEKLPTSSTEALQSMTSTDPRFWQTENQPALASSGDNDAVIAATGKESHMSLLN